MTLLTPLGLLGLIGILVLIIIYIIRPNFQQKVVSSTYVWKLSLKYRKKRLPTSKLRDLLLIICQILVLASCAFIIAKPACIVKSTETNSETVIIIDSSASMLMSSNGKTRFERAVEAAGTKAGEVLDGGGEVTVITAGPKAEYLCEKETKENKEAVLREIKGLWSDNQNDIKCTYGSDDIDGAMTLCADTVADNPKANVFIYTDATYVNGSVPEGVNVIDVKGEDESNIAILSATAELYQNYYVFTVEIARYGNETSPVMLSANFSGINGDEDDNGNLVIDDVEVPCLNGVTYKVVYRTDLTEDYTFIEESNLIMVKLTTGGGSSEEDDYGYGIYSFKQAIFSVNENDSFAIDNYYYIFGGDKEELKILYVTKLSNTFMPAAIELMKTFYSSRFDIVWEQKDYTKGDYELVGYDLYIFEHCTPAFMPTDGVTFLFDPTDGNFTDSGFSLGREIKSSEPLGDPITATSDSKLLTNIKTEEITVSAANEILLTDSEDEDGYKTFWELAGYPIAAARKNGKNQSVIFSFSIHYSNIAITGNLVLFMSNLIDYYFPATVNGNTFAVGEKIELNSRGEKVTVNGGMSEEIPIDYTSFPTTLVFDRPGACTISQRTYFDKELAENIYIGIAKSESMLTEERYALENPFTERDDSDYFNDLLVYLAAALVALLFVEWWLQSRESM